MIFKTEFILCNKDLNIFNNTDSALILIDIDFKSK